MVSVPHGPEDDPPSNVQSESQQQPHAPVQCPHHPLTSSPHMVSSLSSSQGGVRRGEVF